jgi:hypothetical protein
MARTQVCDEACVLCCSPARVTHLFYIADPIGDIQRIWLTTECSNPTCPDS